MDEVQEALLVVCANPEARGQRFLRAYYRPVLKASEKGRQTLITRLEKVVAGVQANK